MPRYYFHYFHLIEPARDWTGWFVAIVDEHGHKIDQVPIVDL